MGAVTKPASPSHFKGAAIRHSAELVWGDFRPKLACALAAEGPRIRPSGTFSPGGEGPPRRVPSQLIETVRGEQQRARTETPTRIVCARVSGEGSEAQGPGSKRRCAGR